MIPKSENKQNPESHVDEEKSLKDIELQNLLKHLTDKQKDAIIEFIKSFT